MKQHFKNCQEVRHRTLASTSLALPSQQQQCGFNEEREARTS